MEFRKSAPADIDEMMQIVNDAKLLLKNKISISGRRDTPTGRCWKKTLPTELVTYYVTAAVSPGCVQLRSELMKAMKNRRRLENDRQQLCRRTPNGRCRRQPRQRFGRENLQRSRKTRPLPQSLQRPGRYPPRKHCNAAHYGKKRLSAVRHHPYQGRRRRRTTAHRRGETIV